MDGITEPVVLVLGHPIAGNPAQFAFERAFAALDLSWRVLSCDVSPERIEQAIDGADVLGFRGLLLDRNLTGRSDGAESRPDLYYRASRSGSGWQSEDVLATWLKQAISQHFQNLEREIGRLLWIGTPDESFPAGLASEQSVSPIAWASAESIEKANLIAITEPVDVSTWPTASEGTLVVDFANPPNNLDRIRALGYEALGRDESRIGILTESFRRWTGQTPSEDVLTEAIEEYLAV
ncbi:hypothetical protein FYK55_18685 [Roseiconus nitratireducens]|uniref:Uncharacterized protein n=1 Tax=Roseiconus nitratireducens TaxID=2605748 RepID=A0A5M6D2X4_9BACT|nr:hypothetical protein [Roseiconus nitratireducens]KAA5540940.1 hypothetical protein FYK55_18685 [Roseiconus nitratireducens]